jgi:hypothetical protein
VSREQSLHLDEARSQLVGAIRKAWQDLALKRVLVIEDSFGRFSLGCWGDRRAEPRLEELLTGVAPYAASLFWAPEPGEFDALGLDRSWEEAEGVDDLQEAEIDDIRLTVRHRMLPAWQQYRKSPLWPSASDTGCPIVAFYSFKGGMGRTTALAAFAVHRACRDDRVVVIDLDLDAPGLGSMLSTPSPSCYGVVDYLLETPILGRRPDDLLDYSWLVDLGKQATTGSVRVFPAGQLDRHYLGKMARLDFDQPDDECLRHPLDELLLHVRDEFHPDWILLDSRTGFSETAGMLLSGLAHLHVLLGVDSDQSWQGLAYAVRKLGAERVRRGLPQSEAMLVHALVPDLKKEQKDDLVRRFAEHAEDLFRDEYYIREDPERDDAYWYVDDAVGDAAPHRPWPLLYSQALAQSVSFDDLVHGLESASDGYRSLCEALAKRARFGAGE